jgi:hypothetical protein
LSTQSTVLVPLGKVPVDEILGRLRRLYKADSEVELAKILQVPQSTLSSWKQRGSIPFNLLLAQAAIQSVTLDWLIFGEGAENRPFRGALDKDVLAICVKKVLARPDVRNDAVETIDRYYPLLYALVDSLLKSGALQRADALRVAEDTFGKWQNEVGQ